MQIRTETRLIQLHGFAAIFQVLYVAILGIIMALKFHWPDWFSGSAEWSWGRLRYAHTQGIFFGWLGNTYLAFMYYAVPRLAQRPVLSTWLGWLLFLLWNGGIVFPGWYLVQSGVSQSLEWGEFPIQIDLVVLLALVLSCCQFVWPLLQNRLLSLYVSAWYVIGGLIFTTLAYPIGNFIPEYVPGARGATFSGLWIHDAIGLYVTPMALAISYMVIPLSTGRPIFSHFLSMIGFWLLFFVYPLNGTHHYIFSSIPMSAQKGAIIASIYLAVAVIVVVTNQLMSLKSRSDSARADLPLRFIWVGIICYLLVSLQGSFQALMPLNRFVHFSDWVIGHAHLALIGFASFTSMGGLLFIWSRTPGFRYNRSLANWSFWLLVIGLLGMVSSLTIAGLVQGKIWDSELTWMESVRASKPYWQIRSLSGIVILSAFISFFLSLTTGKRVTSVAPISQSYHHSLSNAEDATAESKAGATGDDLHPSSESVSTQSLNSEENNTIPQIVDIRANRSENATGGHRPNRSIRWLKQGYAIMGIAGIGFFGLSFLVLAVSPNAELSKEIEKSQPAYRQGYTASESRGRKIYIREGCMNCHSQFVRQTIADVNRFGVASSAWENEFDFPQLWGTRRIGPDLSRLYGMRTRDWHYVHLYQPRWVVSDSIMPRYPWLFDGSCDQPTNEAIDLVAYLDSLGREAVLANRSGPRQILNSDPDLELAMGIFCDCAIPRTTGPAPIYYNDHLANGERDRFAGWGLRLFQSNCSSCHGPAGQGDGPAAKYLVPPPKNLKNTYWSDLYLSGIIWHGVTGSSMPKWFELSTQDFRSLMIYVQSLADADIMEADKPLTEAELLSTRQLFELQCATCHGLSGAGDGLSAGVLFPKPVNFQQYRATKTHIDKVLAKGIPGTAMSSWEGKLTSADRSLLAVYIRSLYQGNKKR